eukprot:c29739_g1_i1 orf=467-1276(-)
MLLRIASPPLAGLAPTSCFHLRDSELVCRSNKSCCWGVRPNRQGASSLSSSRPAPLVKAQIGGGSETKTMGGVLFEPFVEVQSELVKVPCTSSESFARQHYDVACEMAVNEQINVEYSVSYFYHALFAYFDRDNVALPGFAKFFKEASDDERSHAEKLMKFQNIRGGRVKLESIVSPGLTECDHAEKGDALYAMEMSLAMEKMVNAKLLHLHKVAELHNDPHMQNFVESEFLEEQAEDIKKISEYVSQLRRVGKGHGVYHFDLVLQGHA